MFFYLLQKGLLLGNYNDIKIYVIYINQTQRTFYFISQIFRSFLWGFGIDFRISRIVNLNIFGRGVKKFEVVEVFIGSVKFFEVLLWDLVFILESVDVNLNIFGRRIKKFEAVEIFRNLKYRV